MKPGLRGSAEPQVRSLSPSALAWVARTNRNAAHNQRVAVLATKEVPLFVFHARSPFADRRAFQYGHAIDFKTQVGGYSFVLSERPYRFDDEDLRVKWVDGRLAPFGCHGGDCWSCDDMPGASHRAPEGL
mgnify:CR=1 FL=1